MKRIMCALTAALMLWCTALAEPAAPEIPAASESPAIELITPTPSPEPLGETFSSEDLIVTLPYGFAPMDDAAFEGYAAAAQNDYPDAARTILAAMNADGSAAITFSISESAQDAAAAAREAAEKIIGSSSSVMDWQYGENSCSGFACAIGDQTYRLYYFFNGTQLLVVGVSGIEEAAIASMLESIVF